MGGWVENWDYGGRSASVCRHLLFSFEVAIMGLEKGRRGEGSGAFESRCVLDGLVGDVVELEPDDSSASSASQIDRYTHLIPAAESLSLDRDALCSLRETKVSGAREGEGLVGRRGVRGGLRVDVTAERVCVCCRCLTEFI
jgi:hypothetical protein